MCPLHNITYLCKPTKNWFNKPKGTHSNKICSGDAFGNCYAFLSNKKKVQINEIKIEIQITTVELPMAKTKSTNSRMVREDMQRGKSSRERQTNEGKRASDHKSSLRDIHTSEMRWERQPNWVSLRILKFYVLRWNL